MSLVNWMILRSAMQIGAKEEDFMATFIFDRYLLINNFVGSGSVDDSSAFQNAINSYLADYPNTSIRLPDGTKTVRFDSSISINVTSLGLLDLGGASINASALSGTNPAFILFGTSDSGNTQSRQHTKGIRNGYIVGPGEGTAVPAVRLDGASSIKGSQLTFLQNLFISDFGKGVYIAGINCYLNRFKEILMVNVENPIVIDNVNNTGERLVIDNCVFGGCSGAQITNANAGADIYVNNTSIDFFGGEVFTMTAGQLNFVNCHIEGDNNVSWGSATGNGVSVNFTNCRLVASAVTPAPDPTAWFTITSPASLRFRDCHLSDFQGHDHTVQTLTTGTGIVSVSGSQMFGISSMCPVLSDNMDNLLVDGSFETVHFSGGFEINVNGNSSSIAWPSLSDASGNAASISSAQAHGGTKSLLLAKATAAGNAWDVVFYVPLPKDRGYVGWSLWLMNPGSVAGTFVYSGYYVALSSGVSQTSGGQQELRIGTVFSSSPQTPGATWGQYSMKPGTTDQNLLGMAPLWATHVAIRLRMSSMGIGSYYVDDLMVTNW